MSTKKYNYSKYLEQLKNMSGPIMPSELPHIKIDFKAISKYAKENGICIAELSEEEKRKLAELFTEK